MKQREGKVLRPLIMHVQGTDTYTTVHFSEALRDAGVAVVEYNPPDTGFLAASIDVEDIRRRVECSPHQRTNDDAIRTHQVNEPVHPGPGRLTITPAQTQNVSNIRTGTAGELDAIEALLDRVGVNFVYGELREHTRPQRVRVRTFQGPQTWITRKHLGWRFEDDREVQNGEWSYWYFDQNNRKQRSKLHQAATFRDGLLAALQEIINDPPAVGPGPLSYRLKEAAYHAIDIAVSSLFDR